MTALARIAVTASALAEADHAVTVTWCDERGNWHTAYTDEPESIPAATLATVAVARDGKLVTMETESIGEGKVA
jgi:hypothetical protein